MSAHIGPVYRWDCDPVAWKHCLLISWAVPDMSLEPLLVSSPEDVLWARHVLGKGAAAEREAAGCLPAPWGPGLGGQMLNSPGIT